MHHLACLLTLLVPPQEPVHVLTAIGDAELRGPAAFEPDAIRSALRRDGDVWTELGEARSLGAQARLLARRVREGYLHAGFRRATVEGAVDGGRIVLTIDEGDPIVCGAVRATGCTALDAGVVSAEVARPGPAGWKGWVDGAPAGCDARILEQAVLQVERAYAGAGRWGVHSRARLHETAGRMELRLEVTDEGREVRIGRVELQGERPAQVEAVLARLAAEPGAIYSTTFAEDLRARLDQTGRYSSVRLPDPRTAVDGRLDPFSIRVAVPAKTPALEDVRWADVEQLRRARSWIQEALRHGACFTTRAQSDTEPTEGPALADGTVQVWFSRDGLAIACEGLTLKGFSIGTLAMAWTGEQLWIGDGSGSVGVAAPETGQHFAVSLQLTPSLQPDQTLEFRWGVGTSKNPDAVAPKVDMTDAALVLLAHDTESGLIRATDSGALLLGPSGESDQCLTIARDGALSGHLVIEGETAGQRVALTVDARHLAEVSTALRQRFCPGAQPVPLLEFLTTRGSGLGKALLEHLSPTWQEALPLGRALFDYLGSGIDAMAAARRATGPEFPLPSPRSGTGSMAPILRAIVHEAVPRIGPDTWAGVLLLACPDLLFGTPAERTATVSRLHQLAGQETTGPLALLTTALLFERLGLERETRMHARAGLERVTFEAALRDLMVFAPAGSPGERWLLGLGAFWRGRPELAAIFRDLGGEGEGANRAALEHGLRALWDAAPGQLVRGRLETLAK